MVTITEAILIAFYMFNLGVMYSDEKKIKEKKLEDELALNNKSPDIKFEEIEGWMVSSCTHIEGCACNKHTFNSTDEANQ